MKSSDWWFKHATLISLCIIALLILVLVPHVGKVVNGSRRWIGVLGIGLQPSELAKLAIVLFMAYFFTIKQHSLRFIVKDYLSLLFILGLLILLTLLEPDMGTATVVFILALTMFYMSDMINNKLLLLFVLFGIVGFIILIVIEPYRMRRFLGFMNPWQDALGKGYQLTHSLLAFGHGGWLGVGIGNSIEKLFYLPEAHTDFILSIIAEETGVVGVCVIIGLFWLIFYRGFCVISVQCQMLYNRKFQSLLSQGISTWFLIQALINIGVAIGLLPTKGLTLPFISYGGSSILVNCIATALLLRIDYENKCLKKSLRFHE